MEEALLKSFKDIFSTLGKYIVPSVIFAVLIMFVIIQISKSDLKTIAKEWIDNFKKNKFFRWQTAFFVYLYLLISRTIFSRTVSKRSPFRDIMGGWLIYGNNGKYDYQAIENLLLFVPYTFLLYAAFMDREHKYTNGEIVKKGALISVVSTSFIEIVQVVFRIGTFQFADLFYNTLGGICGTILFAIVLRISHRN